MDKIINYANEALKFLSRQAGSAPFSQHYWFYNLESNLPTGYNNKNRIIIHQEKETSGILKLGRKIQRT
jgi:hypothetical protein